MSVSYLYEGICMSVSYLYVCICMSVCKRREYTPCGVKAFLLHTEIVSLCVLVCVYIRETP